MTAPDQPRALLPDLGGTGAGTAVILWASYRPERLRQAGVDYVCERVEDREAAIDALQASG